MKLMVLTLMMNALTPHDYEHDTDDTDGETDDDNDHGKDGLTAAAPHAGAVPDPGLREYQNPKITQTETQIVRAKGWESRHTYGQHKNKATKKTVTRTSQRQRASPRSPQDDQLFQKHIFFPCGVIKSTALGHPNLTSDAD